MPPHLCHLFSWLQLVLLYKILQNRFKKSNDFHFQGFKCFVHSIFRFWFLVTFDDEITKTRKFYVLFVYILQGKMGKTEKKWKEDHATKVTKIPKTKNMG
jgi:hypothetical protein